MLETARRLTALMIPLAALASATGLFAPGVYRDNGWVVPQNRGQDLVTLLVLPVLAAALRSAHQGSSRHTLLWLGLLGYLFYTYTGASFAYAFNLLFPVYVALFSLSVFALVAAIVSLSRLRAESTFDEATPRKAVAGFLALLALLLTMAYLSQILPFYTMGRLPKPVELAGAPTMFVYVLDLGLIVPLSLLAARWLWRQYRWGEVLAACLLVKAATMGLALLSMTWFSLEAGLEVEAGLVALWAMVAGGGSAMTAWLLHHCRDTARLAG
jgi:hypothetical protein